MQLKLLESSICLSGCTGWHGHNNSTHSRHAGTCMCVRVHAARDAPAGRPSWPAPPPGAGGQSCSAPPTHPCHHPHGCSPCPARAHGTARGQSLPGCSSSASRHGQTQGRTHRGRGGGAKGKQGAERASGWAHPHTQPASRGSTWSLGTLLDQAEGALASCGMCALTAAARHGVPPLQHTRRDCNAARSTLAAHSALFAAIAVDAASLQAGVARKKTAALHALTHSG